MMKYRDKKDIESVQLHIDKTASLEKGIAVFPSIYIEGASATGKSTAVDMLCHAHPEITPVLFLSEQDYEHFTDKAAQLLEKMSSAASEENTIWVIFDQIDDKKDAVLLKEIKNFLLSMPPGNKGILMGRFLPKEFLELLWKRKMELISQRELFFDRRDIKEYLEKSKSRLSTDKIYKLTGGWPGCVDMMVRLDKGLLNETELFHSYEIETYIEQEMLGALEEIEKMLVNLARILPWLDGELCEYVLGNNAENDKEMNREDLKKTDRKEQNMIRRSLCESYWEEMLKKLTRKGIFKYNKTKEYYILEALFANTAGNVVSKDFDFLEKFSVEAAKKISEKTAKEGKAECRMTEEKTSVWNRLGFWYEARGYLREADTSFKREADRQALLAFYLRHYDRIPFLDVDYREILSVDSEKTKNFCEKQRILYLKAMWHRSRQEFGRQREIIEMMRHFKGEDTSTEQERKEILLNLVYACPEEPFSSWMGMVEEAAKKKEKYHLYGMLGMGYSFLSGLRDLSGLFACTKKEAGRQAGLWETVFGEKEQIGFALARIDFYMETRQRDSLKEKDLRILEYAIGKNREWPGEGGYLSMPWRFRLAALYLLCKWPELENEERNPYWIHKLEEHLLEENLPICEENTQAIVSLYSLWWQEPEQLSYWLHQHKEQPGIYITEENDTEYFARAKGHLHLNHYDKSEQILKKLMPHFKKYHRYRYFAESLFGMAIISWHKEQKGQAFRYMMESFLVTGKSRYVNFYVQYDKKCVEVMQGYIEWLQNTTPEAWHRKKKYNYGNVLRMPMEDYLEVILRRAKKRGGSVGKIPAENQVEHLTMMETIILQSISRGMTNAQICEEQNLKLPTVKTHIYSLYKKLEVKSRVQAVNKGKEMGLLK